MKTAVTRKQLNNMFKAPGKDKQLALASVMNYVHRKLEMDKLLEQLITPYIKNKKLKILDACCGIGHLMPHLDKISPQSTYLGVDGLDFMIRQAKKLFNKQNIAFETADVIYDLPKRYPKAFDITINWKTLSWLPHYEQMMQALFKVSKKHIFLSSLFYDGEIDFEIKVREYQKEAGKYGFNVYYNIYSLPRFIKFVKNLGAKKVGVYDFEMPIDLPRGNPDFMGTYTVKLANGKRLQISGAVLMLWKIIRIDL